MNEKDGVTKNLHAVSVPYASLKVESRSPPPGLISPAC
jgi:hypothetical protein